MKFQPVTSQYRFDESLTENYPDYLRDPIYSWIKSLLWEEVKAGIGVPINGPKLKVRPF